MSEELRCRGLTTDLMIGELEGDVQWRSDYVVVRTPASPRFWWGNFLLLLERPKDDQVARWEQTFDKEIAATVHGIQHRHFTWDDPEGGKGCEASFIEKGYSLNQDEYLFANRINRPDHFNEILEVRPLLSDQDWDGSLAAQEPMDDRESSAEFLRTQVQLNRRLVQTGHARWFGGFVDNRLVATMGIVVRFGLARCQAVATAPGHRKKGYASTLIYRVCSHATDEMGAQEIAIMADIQNPSLRLYKSLGFEFRETLTSVSISTSP